MRTYTFTTEQLEEFSNQVKDVLLIHLEEIGIITSAEDISKSKVIIIRKRSQLSRFFRKILNKKEDTEIMICTF